MRYRGRHRAAGTSAARRFAALGMLSSSTVAAVMFIAPSPVAANAPAVAAWWNAANLGDPAPAPPAPPDVKEGDLLVQGSNPGAIPNPLGAAPATSQAVAGVSFDLPPAALVGALTLQIDGTPPAQTSVVACRATETFTSDENGPWSQVPPYDGNGCVPGKLKGSDVVFADVNKLVLHDKLQVLILPGPVDRVVFKPPNDNTLVVKDSGGIGASAPSFGAGAGSTPVSGGAGSSGTAPVGGSAVANPPSSSTVDLPSSGTTTATGTDVPPVVAGQGTGTPVAQQSRAQAASSGLSTRDRRIIALIVIAAEVLGYALLMRNRAPAAAPAAAGAALVGGRLRAPDRWTNRGAGVAGSAGVGRFRRERVGAAPYL
jgi:hypothetical protein